jgi:L-seryl-tRNA(Ser) seleniumtransferase
MNKDIYRNIPGVDKLLVRDDIKEMIHQYNADLVKFAIRQILDSVRNEINSLKKLPSEQDIVRRISQQVNSLTGKSLKKVYNATGIIVHTNLGRSPLSESLIQEVVDNLKGYNNLEFDLEKGDRGSRHIHLSSKLKYLTGAEDVLVVNNNAAAVMLVLSTFAKNREVIVSRGELIEIGGSFRLPEIMAASGCRMAEVGATNKTHLKDYEKAVNENTAMLFKAHKSNYVIAGFTKEVGLPELVQLGKKNNLPVVYDMGSGLLRKIPVEKLENEPDVRQTLSIGVDLVTFSGDKLIGGPQAGIIAGKTKYISKLRNEPMVRALRIGKTTIAFMEAALSLYFDNKALKSKNGVFMALNQSKDQLKSRAYHFQAMLKERKITSEVTESEAFCGGGALPGESVPSFAVKITGRFKNNSDKASFAEKLYYGLMQTDHPVIGVLRKGEFFLNMMTLDDNDTGVITEQINLVNSLIK